jgi:acyl-lipid omega-6 desaturase (Delta-12 desaturase)
MRSGKELLIASKKFAEEDRWLSWWHLWSTLVLMLGAMAGAALIPTLWISIPLSIFAGLVLVRMFIVFHDYMHGTILKGSPVAEVILSCYGLVSLNPPSTWKHSHDDHHKHNSKKLGPSMGSFPIMSTEEYRTASLWKRMGYTISRHPVTIMLGYLTAFFCGTCLFPFLRNPIKNRQNGLAMLVHIGIAIALAMVSWQAMILGLMVPFFVASALGAYLFYAQHNFPGIERRHDEDWDHVHAALRSSSFMKMGSLMNWFTGNIGYHHVHHLNAKIPFYRLPEAMKAIKELQSPVVTTLALNDIYACLRLQLWDAKRKKLVSFREAQQLGQCA